MIDLPKSLLDEATQWRRQIHQNPELGFKEVETSEFIAEKLTAFGIEVTTGLATTGLVGTLKNGEGPTIGLRSDIDALPIDELNTFAYKSKHAKRMHACGHDGHTAMLLATAKYLSENRCFNGTIHFIFQPAEENWGGGQVMIKQGLFEKFPVDAVYGLHNWPGLALGQVAVNSGAMMASFDTFEITLTGQGTHAAMPHLGSDPIMAAAELIGNVQSIVARQISPLQSGVISMTQIHGGDTLNVIPDVVVLKGTVRSFDPVIRQYLQDKLTQMAETLPALHGVEGKMDYTVRYPVTKNHPEAAENVAKAAISVLGEENVYRQIEPSMAGEDFAFMTQVVKGAYFWLGVDEQIPSKPLHNPSYDFNDHAIKYGISVWLEIVKQQLPQK